MNNTESLVDTAELNQFRQYVAQFRANVMRDEEFTALRLQQGVYGQRQDGFHMVRVKVPGGRLNPKQLDALSHVLARHSRTPVASVTTRQDIQLHFVPLDSVPATLQALGASGLTTREACGNTVRNITACPLAGACPREHTDVTQHVGAAAKYFLRHPLTQHLPRKFKMSFSGCESDCAQALIHDVGVVAVNQNGKRGFRIYAGGGLGHKPREAVVVQSFVEPHQLLGAIEAALALHNRYSDRKKRAKSRLKFLVDKFGVAGFIERYKIEYERIASAVENHALDNVAWFEPSPSAPQITASPRRALEQRQSGLWAIVIALPLGDITAPQLRALSKIMRTEGLTDIRATQNQNLILLDVPEERRATIESRLAAVGLHAPVTGGDVVSCPGTWTCRLGVTSSRTTAELLSGGHHDLAIRVSGCHNGCAQPTSGDIGLHGEGCRVHGVLIPHYRMHFGGDGRVGGGIALKGPEIPAQRIDIAVQRVREAYDTRRAANESFRAWAVRSGAVFFNELLRDLEEIKPDDVPILRRDHGDNADFRVLQLGGGECAGVADEYVAAHFAEAENEQRYRRSFALNRKPAEALECCEAVLQHAAKALVFRATNEAVADNDHGKIAQRIAAIDIDLGHHYELLAEHVKAQRAEPVVEIDLTKTFESVDAWLAATRERCFAPPEIQSHRQSLEIDKHPRLPGLPLEGNECMDAGGRATQGAVVEGATPAP